ncbi:mitofusin [Agyrium rufum]|nr:mitofusin [Agyrium rufum]
MSQDHPHPAGRAEQLSKPRRPSSIRSGTTGNDFLRPQFMTVGNGSTSAEADALMASFDHDSGYGDSMGDSALSYGGLGPNWMANMHDLPTPVHTPRRDGEGPSDHERQLMASHLHQKMYDQNRSTLARSITRAIETLRELQDMNGRWPAQYPSVPAISDATPTRTDPRPGMQHTQSTRGNFDASVELSPQRPGPRRAMTSLGAEAAAESSKAVEKRVQEPEKLITSEAAHDFSILKIDLQLQGLPQSEIARSLDKKAIASLLDGRISSSIRHLQLLQERIEDTSSKVLVTGDLNAGKSTFCNALLRRKVLPEDQQPCTSIFCEVLDARENSYIEEVHAIHKHRVYDRRDESSYDVYTLQELEKIVTENDRYTQCKVYVKDVRTVDESLLNNKIVDISIIDAPGLNSDSLKTTAVFARQEEIDVVVFVVSAANHFTLSAKEFILNAAHEKAYIFIVVNGFDQIRDKEKCQRIILDQVNKLSPRTYKESDELVHFVSSNAIPVAPALPPPPRGGDGGSGGGGGGGSGASGASNDFPSDFDEDDVPVKHGEPGSPPGKGKGKQKEQLQDFQELEGSLRRFVLEKRARSKLAPAKTYLLNILRDLDSLATVNNEIAQSELERVTKELSELEPACEKSRRNKVQISDDIDRTIETGTSNVYNETTEILTTTIARVADANLGVEYPGLLSAFRYAADLQAAMLDQISDAVTLCEEKARAKAVAGVAEINSLGTLHLDEEYHELQFKADMMFRRKRDVLARQVDTSVEIKDFFDISGIWQRQEKVAGTSMAVTVAGIVGGRLIGGVGWLDGALGAARVLGTRGLKHLIVPGLIVTVLLSTAYVLHQIPNTLPPLLSSRLSLRLADIQYTHLNANRISSEVSKVLRFPADNLRLGLQHSVEKLTAKRDDIKGVKRKSDEARKYFSNLCREAREGTDQVERIDLDGNNLPALT